MSIFDDIKGKAADLVNGNEDAILDGIEKAGDFIDSKTDDKYQGHIDGIQKSAANFVDGLSGNRSTAEEVPAQGTPSADERV